MKSTVAQEITVEEFRRMTGAASSGYGHEARIIRAIPFTVEIIIPKLPPSLNEWSRKHWRVRHREVTEMTANLQALVAVKKLPRFTKATVQLVYYFRDGRHRDPDNYVPKFLLDGLRKAKIISDDNSTVLRLPQPEFRVNRERPRTEVFISEWEGEE